MKKIITALFFITICSCSNNTNTTNSANDSTHVTYDASKADTTSVPNTINSETPENIDTSATKPDSINK